MLILIAMLAIGQEPITNPILVRKQAAYKEWAKALRETDEGAKKIVAKKRDAWAAKTLREKESKIRAKYRATQFQLTLTLKEAVISRWPTESPADLAYAQRIIDPLIFEDELTAWSDSNMPFRRSIPRSASGQDVTGIMQDSINDQIINKRNAPIAKCPAKDAAGRICDRKTVGNPGTKCYEHR